MMRACDLMLQQFDLMPHSIYNNRSDHFFDEFAAEFAQDAEELEVALEADMVVQEFEEFVGGLVGDHGLETGQIGLYFFGGLESVDDRPYALRYLGLQKLFFCLLHSDVCYLFLILVLRQDLLLLFGEARYFLLEILDFLLFFSLLSLQFLQRLSLKPRLVIFLESE